MKERLFLDRIDLQRCDVPSGNLQYTAFVVADFADSLEPVGNSAPMTAGIAAHRMVLEPIVELRRSLRRSDGKEFAERRLLGCRHLFRKPDLSKANSDRRG